MTTNYSMRTRPYFFAPDCFRMLLSVPGGYVQIWFARHGLRTRLGRMMKLSVTPFLTHLNPTVRFELGQHFTNVRSHPRSQSYADPAFGESSVPSGATSNISIDSLRHCRCSISSSNA